jgi:dTDP-4-dehydrorhamnose reductase
MRIYITGHRGFLGSRLLSDLKTLHEIFVNDLYINTDSYAYYEKWLCSLKPEVIIHCAAESNVTRCEVRHDLANVKNIQTTQILVDISHKIDSTFIFISSDQVYHRSINSGKEMEICQPENYYGYTKLKGEQIVVENLNKYYILRISMQLGFDSEELGKNKNQLLIKMIRKARKGNLITCDKNCYRSYAYIYDTVDAIRNILTLHIPTGIYNVSSDCEMSIANVYRYILQLAKFPRDVIETVIYEKDNETVYDARIDNSKLINVSCALPSLINGLNRCMKEYESL